MTIRDWSWNDGDFTLAASGDIAVVEEGRVIAQDLLARLISPRGSHWAHPADGLDSQRYIQATADPLTALALKQDVELEVARDARVVRADATLDTLDLRSGSVRVLAELRDRMLAMAAPLPTGPVAEREYGTFFVAAENGAVVELAANRRGSLEETDENVIFVDMNPAHFLGTRTEVLIVNGIEYPVEVVDLNV